MPFLFASIAVILLILVFPLNLSTRSLAAIDEQFVLNNLKMGLFPSVVIKLELTENGIVLVRKKEEKNLSRKEDKEKSGSGKKNIQLIRKLVSDSRFLSMIRIREISVNGGFGSDNAATTAMVCASSIILLDLIHNKMKFVEQYSRTIIPQYGGVFFKLTININLQFNFIIIFLLLIEILFKNIKMKKIEQTPKNID